VNWKFFLKPRRLNTLVFGGYEFHIGYGADALRGTQGVTSRFVASRFVASRFVALRFVASRFVASRFVASHFVASQFVASRSMASRFVGSRFAVERFAASWFVASQFVASRFVAARFEAVWDKSCNKKHLEPIGFVCSGTCLILCPRGVILTGLHHRTITFRGLQGVLTPKSFHTAAPTMIFEEDCICALRSLC
jgi:hypothetical protein